MPEIISHSITGKPYSSLPTNLWIEMTMNKGSEMKAGWQIILGNENMLSTNVRNINYINQLRVILHKIADMKVYKSGHNPANVQLRSFQSGQLISEEVKDDLLSAFDDGEKKVREFFDERIFSRIKDWGIGELVNGTEKSSSQ